jgi:hypothetical protein
VVADGEYHSMLHEGLEEAWSRDWTPYSICGRETEGVVVDSIDHFLHRVKSINDD